MSVPSLGAEKTFGSNSQFANLHRATMMTRVGNRYYFAYLTADSPPLVKLVPYNIDTASFESEITVFTGLGSESGSHEAPAVWMRPGGGVRVAFHHHSQPALNSEANGLSPRYRELPDPADAATWSPDAKGVPIRASAQFDATWTNKTLASQYDNYAVHDELSGRCYMISEASQFWPGGVQEEGFPTALTIFPADGSVDGPYVLVHSRTGYPVGVSDPGNVFVKGFIRLGHSAVGPKPLYLFWETRNTFRYSPRKVLGTWTDVGTTLAMQGYTGSDPDLPTYSCTIRVDNEDIIYGARVGSTLTGCTRGANGTTPAAHSSGTNIRSALITHNYQIYCAVSRDGGHTWQNLDGTASFTKEAGVQWNDALFQIEAEVGEDHSQGTGASGAIDRSTRRPLTVHSKRRAGSGLLVQGHADSGGGVFTGVPGIGIWDLVLDRPTGNGEEHITVQAQSGDESLPSTGFVGTRHLTHETPDGTIVALIQRNGGGGIGYRYSQDAGSTWSSEVVIDSANGNLRWMTSWVDPLRPNVIHLVYRMQNNGTMLRWREITVGPADSLPNEEWTREELTEDPEVSQGTWTPRSSSPTSWTPE